MWRYILALFLGTYYTTVRTIYYILYTVYCILIPINTYNNPNTHQCNPTHNPISSLPPTILLPSVRAWLPPGQQCRAGGVLEAAEGGQAGHCPVTGDHTIYIYIHIYDININTNNTNTNTTTYNNMNTTTTTTATTNTTTSYSTTTTTNNTTTDNTTTTPPPSSPSWGPLLASSAP
jgi:hypothetical protein